MVACKELKRMFDIEDDEEDSHQNLPCKKYHKSVDLGRAGQQAQARV